MMLVAVLAFVFAPQPQSSQASASPIISDDGCTANTFARNDDNSVRVNLGFDVNWYGQTHDFFQLNNNGAIKWGAALTWGQFSGLDLTADNDPLIAVGFTDIDTRNPATQAVTHGPLQGTFQGLSGYCINWVNVGDYNQGGPVKSFQLLLLDASQTNDDVVLVMNYALMGGSNVITGWAGPSRQGYIFAGDLPPSGTSGQLGTGPSSLVAKSFAPAGFTTVPGRYIFKIEGGAPTAAPGAPEPPTAPAASSSGSSNVSLTFNASPTVNPVVTNYTFQFRETPDGPWQNAGTVTRASATATTVTIGGLTNGRTYEFRAASFGGVSSAPSVASNTVTLTGVPSAPTISSISQGPGEVSVSFSPPANSGGLALENYEYSTDGTNFVPFSPARTTSPLTISGLTAGVTYPIKIRAVNSAGPGTPSSSVNGSAQPTPGAPQILSLVASNQALGITFIPPTYVGTSPISNYEYSTDGTNFVPFSPSATASPLSITSVSAPGRAPLVNGTSYSITLRALNATGPSVPSATVSGSPAAPATPSSSGSGGPVTPPALVTPPRALPRVLPTPPPVVGPVVSGTPSAPPSAPTALIGGRPLVVSTQVTDPNNISLRAGVLNIGMNVPSDQGSVRQQGGSTEIQVRNGGVASVSGSGVLPRSTVQVFMPLGGSNSREIARIPVDATGSFSGDALFGSTPTEAPLPIGRHVLQMVTVDENRQQTVVELTVNIAQPPPAPELNRSTNERPTLLPGQSIATNGGSPEPVTVTPIPDQKQATIQGDGWSMAVGVEAENGGVASGEGGAVVTFVRDQGAVVSGTGFMPGTRADVWLFSDPTLLGTVEIDENGEFNGVVNIDGNVVTVGEHTLQLQGVGEDGFVRAANLGVSVMDEAPALTAESSFSFFWLWLVLIAVVAALLVFALWRYRRSRA